MAQAMLDAKKKNFTRTIASQTGEDTEFCIQLSNSKSVQLYYSKSYKKYVVSFNFGNYKKYIITKQMWLVLRKFIPQIDLILLKQND